MAEFLHDLNIHGAGQIQFKTTAGANAGKIDQNGNDLVLSNAVGDIIIGNGSDDVFIGDGTNAVDIRFEQNMAIFADSNSTRTLTLGGANTSLILENPTINGTVSLTAATMNNNLIFTTANGHIVFDHEPSGDTGEYTTEVALLKIDVNGTEKTILSRVSEQGALALGADDTVAITAGDTKSVIKANHSWTNENVVFASESGFLAFGFPGNDTSWSNRNVFQFKSDSTTAGDNGLYIGDGGQTQFIDLSRNLKNIGTISSGAITSSGKLIINTGSDDILTLNQTSTDNKWNYINFNNQGTREWFIGQDGDGNFDLYNDNINAYAITVNLSNNSILLNDTVTVAQALTVTSGDVNLSAGNIVVGSQYGIRFNDANTRIYTNTDTPEDLLIEADQDILLTPDGQVNVHSHLVLSDNSYVVSARKFTARDGNGVMLTADDGSSGLSIADNGNASFTGDVQFNGDNYHLMWDKSANRLEFWDNAKLSFGDPGGTPDLEIYHDGSDSIIKDVGTGSLDILSNHVHIKSSGGSSNMAQFFSGGHSYIYANNVLRIEATTSGATITGGATISGTNTFLIESNSTAATFNLNSSTRGFNFINNNATLLSLASDGDATFAGSITGKDSGIIIDSISGPYGRIHGTSSIFLGGSSTSNVQLSAQLIPDADSSRSLGNSSRYWSNAYIDQITTTGNIIVGGTVDGRDIAADGTKLDTIDTNADVTPSWVPSSNPNYLTSSSTQSKYLRSDEADTANAKITFAQNAATIALAGTNHTYIEYYKTGTGNARSAYLGFGASGNNHFNIGNEISGGKVIIDTNSGSVEINDDTTISGALTITGNLNITGDINSYNVTDLDVVDKTITIGKGQTEANSGGSGIIVDGSSASILWDQSNSSWDFNKDIVVPKIIIGSDEDSYIEDVGDSKLQFVVAGIVQAQLVSDGDLILADGLQLNGTIAIGGTGRITGIDTVTDSTDAASKGYVDGLASNYQAAGNYITGSGSLSAQDLTDIGNLSGTNTGDQDLSAYITQTNADARYVLETGGSSSAMTGDLHIIAGSPKIVLQDNTDDDDHQIVFRNNGNGDDYKITTQDFTSAGTGDGLFIGSESSDPVKLVTNDTIALTIDTSQNATFAGSITIPDYIIHSGDGDTKIGFNTDNSVEIRAGGNLQINADASRAYLRYQGTSKLYTDSTGIRVFGTRSIFAADTIANSYSGTAAVEVYKNEDDSVLMIHQDDGNHESKLHFRTGGNDTQLVVPASTYALKIHTETTSDAFRLALDGYLTLASGIAATNTSFSGTMNIAGGIYHIGDTDTFFGFVGGNDTFSLTTGGGSRMDANNAGVRFGGSGARITIIKDEDDMAADSNVALATQQSIKAYVDNSVTGLTEYVAVAGDTMTGHLILNDSKMLKLGNSGAETSIYSDGTDTYIQQTSGNLYLYQGATNKDIIFHCDKDGTDLEIARFDGSDQGLKFKDGKKIIMGDSGDIQIQSDNSNQLFDFYNLSNVIFRQHFLDGDMTFQSDDGSGGVTTYFKLDGGNVNVSVAKNFLFQDNVKAEFGNDGDLEIRHGSGDSYIQNETGHLYIQNYGDDKNIELQTDNGSGGAIKYFRANGATGEAILYHYGTEKLATTSNGIIINNSNSITTDSGRLQVNGAFKATGDIVDVDIPYVIHTGWGDDTSTTANKIIPLGNSVTEQNVSAADGQHFFVAPYAGSVKKIIMKNVAGTLSSGFTTELKLYINGSQSALSGELTASSNAITWEPSSSNTFSAADTISLVYQKSASSKYWREVALTMVLIMDSQDI